MNAIERLALRFVAFLILCIGVGICCWLAEKGSKLVDRLPHWARWALILPIALCCGLAVIFPVHWFIVLLTGYPTELDWLSPAVIRFIEKWGSCALIPFTFVYVGGRVAPYFRVGVAVTLAIAATLLAAFLLYFVLHNGDFVISGWVQFTAFGLLMIGGMIGGIVATRRECR